MANPYGFSRDSRVTISLNLTIDRKWDRSKPGFPLQSKRLSYRWLFCNKH